MESTKERNTLNITENAHLGDINLLVKLNDHSQVALTYKNTVENHDQDQLGNYKNLNHHFSDQDEKISLTLQLKVYNEITFAYIDAKIKNERIQGRHQYFSPENSITISVGKLGVIQGLMANYQHKDWWTRPYFGHEISKLPDRTQSLLWKSEDNFHYLLPVVDKDYRTDLAGDGDGLTIKLSSYAGGFDSCKTLAFALGVGNNPFKLSEKTIKTTLHALRFPTLPREEKRYPETLEYLGWCSWDAFYHRVSETGIIEKMKELKKKELPVKWVMIDDGWLDVEENRLRSFEADKEKFPDGLQSVASKLKEQYGVNWVGVWHTLTAYWGGIHPDSDLAKTMEASLYKTNSDKLIPNPDSSKGFAFWDTWHNKLKKESIDFVKVDSQSAVNNFMMYHDSVGKTARGAHAALEASVGIHFDQSIINCMGMAAENIWNRPISAISRNSDDFVPGEEISFKEHALQNAYNSYYHGHFYWGDWDMYWTMHEEDVQNAVLRAISGGPVYFSDRVGETDTSKIWPLILKDGRILRGDQPGLPTADCLFTNPNEETVPLKVWNTTNEAGIIAAFNIHLKGEQVKGTISPSDVPGLTGDRFAVYDYFNEKISILESKESLQLSLEKEAVQLFLIIPLTGKINPLGLINKYLAPKTVTKQIVYEHKTVIQLIEGGVFGFISTEKPIKAKINGFDAEIRNKAGGFYTIDCSEHEKEVVLEITHG
ncbi:Sip1-related alpha-galactosidase [Lederbergia citrea]|uniref:Alpha-galactosidase n=1 Tax=Lederbergia citrea TaxID=2833581 RepID=A0A942UQ84_9BACI|nr:Sip1-related alpha-galactosidase [Lederbergia citrea]MBS4222933.1 alpha-galactosidase [Lederbergia citrea]